MPLRDILLTLRVFDESGAFVGGTVDVEVLHRRRRERTAYTRMDATGPIRLPSLPGRASRQYRVTVSLPGGPTETRFVAVRPRGRAVVDFVFPASPVRRGRAVGTFAIAGRVTSPGSASMAGVLVVIVDRNVDRDRPLAEAVTDERGQYAVEFTVETPDRKPALDLQARAMANGVVVGVSDVRYGATAREKLDVVIPPGKGARLVSEHEALVGAVARNFAGRLGDLKETDERPDISYLANKTGWDARAVAMAALADQFGQVQTPAGTAIPPPLYYALFRAGLPADQTTLFQSDRRTVERVWKESIAQGVVPPSLEGELPRAAEAFAALGTAQTLTAVPPLALSPLQDVLKVTGLTVDDQQRFAALYTAGRQDLPAFWTSVGETFGRETAERLQVNARVATLTLNNAPLMGKLQGVGGDNGLSDPVQLARAGLHRADKWDGLLNGVPVPDLIPGDTPAARQANYAEYLATQVRLTYPTAAVAQMVEAGDLKVDAPGPVAAFLADHHGQFELGVQTVEQYIARNQLDVPAATVRDVKRLQRAYQLTRSDGTMSSLLARGVDSAYQVVRYDRDTFVRDFAADLGGTDRAGQVHDRSVHIHNAVLNLAIGYLTARNGIVIGARPLAAAGGGDRAVTDEGQIVQPAPTGTGTGVIAYPTLEGLFGSMDFCACEECRSILSPAAYLVDLLNFIDQPPGGDGSPNPQDVLLGRRPDLQHLPLTCENTNTALPYIDVVNETLEYFIANDVNAFTLDDYEGYDTGTALSADLLASPQFVMDEAYAVLLSRRFPAPLPFHEPLEELRRYFEAFEVRLPLAMERFRVNDALERGPNPYGWRDILLEEARLSRAEYSLLANSGPVPAWRMYGFANGTPDADIIAELSNAKRFARRIGTSYMDLAAILRTRLVNPDGDLIPKIERLGVSFGVLNAFKNGAITPAEFDALLPTGTRAPDPADYGGDVKAWVLDDGNFARIMGLIVLVDPNGDPDPCRFDDLEFRHARPMADPTDTSTRLTIPEFVRILRLVRSWKKTGWTLEQTDTAICSLYNPNFGSNLDVDSLADLDAGFEIVVPRLGLLLRVMRALELSVERDLLPLLAVWAPIGTHGDQSLYRQMFLNPAILAQDAVFADNGVGEFLQDPGERLLAHGEALRAAFNLTGDEFDRIVEALQFDANTRLTLRNVSAVFRRGWLARRLAISVAELLLLVEVTGLDPFAPPDLTDPAIERLIALAKDVKARGMNSLGALYLVWNRDPSGRATPDPAIARDLARTLRADFSAIDDQFAVTDDPGGDIARARMALVYGPDVTTTFFSLIDDTITVDVQYTNPQPKLKPAIVNADARLRYDDFVHRLSAEGVFTAQRRQTLKAVPAVPAGFKAAVDALFDRSQDVVEAFFARYPELKGLFDAYVASPAPPEVKRRRLLAGFKPALSRARKAQQSLQRLSAAVGAELPFTQALLAPAAAPFPLHAEGRPERPALDDVVALQRQGLAARFFFRNTATGAVDQEDPAAGNLGYAPGSDNALPEHPTAGSAISGIWRGLVEAPDAGFYNIVVEADTTANVTLRFDGQARPLTQHGAVWRNTDAIELAAGVLYEIVVTVERVKDNLAIMWESPTRSREVIPGRYLYSEAGLATFASAYGRFVKTASLAVNLKLTAGEIAFFGTHADYQIGGDGWLNQLRVNGTPNAVTSAALLGPFAALLEFSRIKSELSPDDESLLDVLRSPAEAAAAGGPLFALTQWDPQTLQDIVAHFGGTIPGLGAFTFFRRVYDAFALVRLMGISGASMIAATTNEPVAATVRSLQGALRARYEPADWRTVVQPINDSLRGLKRDALVACILHQLRTHPATAHIDTADKLFEFFLMDVLMEPCMQTSRIRHALSSVQLFIERCFMNLEPQVPAETLETKRAQWEWMKRYRVWEANRKVFLFAENWLEPELRDDKSPFFKEVEAELLQGEITEDAATVAILNYLSKLEDVALLQPVGIHHINGDPALRTGDIDHVVACTTGSRRKYYYRRREYGYWTAWEPIKLDIEDMPVLPVVWENRLLLFWLQVQKLPPASAQKPAPGQDLIDLTTSDLPPNPQVTTQVILGWSEYYNGKWQPPKTSEVDLPSDVLTSTAAFLRKHLTLTVSDKNEWLRVGIGYTGSERTTFVLYNTHSSPVRLEDQTDEESAFEEMPSQIRYISPIETYPDENLVFYYWSQNYASSLFDPYGFVVRHVLAADTPVKVVAPNHPIDEHPYEAPFLMADRRHAFFVRTTHDVHWVDDSQAIGISFNPDYVAETTIPPIVVEPLQELPKPKFWGDGGPIGPDPGVVDPVGVLQFVTEDAYIHQGLGTSAQVVYGGKAIGPTGAFGDAFAMGRRRARTRRGGSR